MKTINFMNPVTKIYIFPVFLLICSLIFLCSGGYIYLKAEFAQYLLQAAWTSSIERGEAVKPWPWADTYPVGLLTASNSGGQQHVVLAGDSGAVLAFGPGHMSGSALPHQKGHIILAGHRDTSFRFLETTEPGHILKMQNRMGGVSEYEVVSMQVVERNALYLDSDASGVMTLITCYPFHGVPGTNLRLVVTAIKIDRTKETVKYSRTMKKEATI